MNEMLLSSYDDSQMPKLPHAHELNTHLQACAAECLQYHYDLVNSGFMDSSAMLIVT